MIKTNKIKARIGMASATLLVIGAILVSCSGIYNAGVSAGGAGGTISYGGSGGGSCSDGFSWTGNGQHDCKGAAWMKFNVGDPAAGGGTNQYKKDSESLLTVDEKCKDYGSYYRLGLARFEVSDGEFVKYVGQIAYFKQVQQITLGGGKINYAGNAPGALNWDEVKRDFETAKEKLSKESNPSQDTKDFLNQSWNETSWFCWNDDWVNDDNITSTFGTWSTAVAKDGNGNTKLMVNTKTLDSNNSGTVKTKEDVIYVDFRHRFNYEKPTSGSGTFDPAVTYYGVQVSGAVNQTVVQSGTKYTVSSENSGPSRPIGPQEPDLVGESTQRIEVPETGTATVCSKISYDPKVIGWKSKPGGGYEMDPETTQNLGKSSEVCITVERIEEEENELEYGGQLDFYSTSTIKIAAQNGDVNNHNETSNPNEMVTAKLSTKGDKLVVGFSHNIYTEHSGVSGESNPEKDVLVDPACTTYSVLQSSPTLRSLNKNIADMVNHCVSGTYDAWASTEKTVSTTDNVEIKLNPGDIITVCQRITYSPATVYLQRLRHDKLEFDDYYRISEYDPEEMSEFYYYDDEENLHDVSAIWLVNRFGDPLKEGESGYVYVDDELVPAYYARYVSVFDFWEYFTSGEEDGSGYSGACVEVTRPLEPDPSDNPGSGTASPESDPMYAGEDSTMVWNASATSYASHRIMRAQAVAYQIKVEQELESDISKGENPSSVDPCSWYEGKIALNMLRYRCQVIIDDDKHPTGFYGDPQANYDFGQGTPFIVMNNVGDKHCNAFGIQWEYWYGVVRWTGSTPPGTIVSESWESEGKAYWTVYDAICKPILKKPSISVWNGSILTPGGVKTSVSNRFTSDNLPFASTDLNSARRKFGSWSEYLAVVNGKVSDSPFGFGSGASLSFGANSNSLLLANSPMTISNTGSPIGGSNITANSTFRSRLVSYFFGGGTAVQDVSGNLNSINTSNISDTLFIRANGNLTIDKPITINSSTYQTIYDLPQVVIYATGDVNITSNVGQIDAWIISEGTVNTCSTFNTSTEAYVLGYRNADCSNQLTINGPVIAQKVELNRTAGSDPITYTESYNNFSSTIGGYPHSISGEILNLSADTYLWAYAQAGRYGSSYSEAYTRELPPRY